MLPHWIATPRLLLRRWCEQDAPGLKAAIDASLPELQAWMPWAVNEPSPVEIVAQRLRRFADDFDLGREWLYGIFDPTETAVLGGVGLHPRIGADALEIGYWVRTTSTHQGYASEAAAELTSVAFAVTPVARLEIRCDPRNAGSAAIPRRIGYRYVGTLIGNAVTPTGAARDTMVWSLSRAEHAAQPAEPTRRTE